MFKPGHLRKAFFALLVLGIVRAAGEVSSFFLHYGVIYFAEDVPDLIIRIIFDFAAAAVVYVVYRITKHRSGEAQEEKQGKGDKSEKTDENLISDAKLAKIIYTIVIAASVLLVLSSVLLK